MSSNKALNGLAIGDFVKDVVQVFADTVSGVSVPGISGPKMAVFSGHDSTLFPLLTAVGGFDGRSAIVFVSSVCVCV